MKNPIFNRVQFVLSFLGLLVAGFLWYLHATHADIPCGASGGCETVAASPYARFPVGTGPWVAAWGTFAYLAMVVLTFLRTLGASPQRDRVLLGLTVATAAVGAAFSLQLTYVEVFVIHAICRWCVASQIIILGVLLAGVAELTAARRRPALPTSPDTKADL